MSTVNDLAKEILSLALPEEFECSAKELIQGGNRYGSLLNEVEGERKPIAFNSTGYPFHLKEPTYVTEVTVTTRAKTSRLRIEVRPVEGDRWEKFTPDHHDKSTGVITFKVERLAAAIRLFCDKTLILGRERNEGVTRISIGGIRFAELIELSQTYKITSEKFAEFNALVSHATKEIDASKAQLQKQREDANAAVETLSETLTELEQKKSALDEAIETAEGEHAEAEEKLKSATQALETAREKAQESQARFDQLTTQIEERNADKERLIKEGVQLRADLQRLTNNKSLFSDNLEGLCAHADRNIRIYIGLFAAPVTIMAISGVYLLWQAHDFFTLVLTRPPTELKVLLIARSPLVALGYGLISGCWRLARMFGKKIMEIQDFRLRASTLTTIATDVTDAAAIGLDLPDQEKYHLRTHLKMQLLRQQFANAFPAGSQAAPDKVVQKILARTDVEAADTAMSTEEESPPTSLRPVLTASGTRSVPSN